MSQMLTLCVVPEVRRRIAGGLISAASLPLSVYQFRILQDGSRNVVEINDELKLVVRARVKRPITAGEDVRLEDIYPEECFIPQPTLDGRPAAFYLCMSTYLNFTTFFDFTPNTFGADASFESNGPGLRFPVIDQLNERHVFRQLMPRDSLNQLSGLSWPPAPAYYPTVLHHISNTAQADDRLFNVIAGVFSRDYWAEKTKLWEETNLFPHRLNYLKKVIEEYFDGDYVSAIYILAPQFEGIVRDYLGSCGTAPNYRFESCLNQLRERVYSQPIMMFPREVLEAILGFMQKGTFLTETAMVTNPSQQVNRHGIAHGVFTEFETQEIALKYLALLDGLGFVLFHDRLVSGTL